MERTFSIKESLAFGWRKTREHSGLLFKALLVIFAVQVASAVVSRVLEHTLIGVLASFALAVVGVFIGVGFTKIMLKVARGESATLEEIWPPLKLAWKYFLASVLTELIVIVGFLLFVMPGVYFALRYSMVGFSVIDGADVMESLKKSTVMTVGHKWYLLGFFVIIGLVNLLGMLAFFVGLLVTIPLTTIAYAHVYQKLKHSKH